MWNGRSRDLHVTVASESWQAMQWNNASFVITSSITNKKLTRKVQKKGGDDKRERNRAQKRRRKATTAMKKKNYKAYNYFPLKRKRKDLRGIAWLLLRDAKPSTLNRQTVVLNRTCHRVTCGKRDCHTWSSQPRVFYITSRTTHQGSQRPNCII